MKLDAALTGVSSSQDLGNLYAALNKAQQMYTPIKRSGYNKADDFRYATLRDIVDATMPGLLANGFTMPTFQMGRDEKTGQWMGVGTLVHASGEWISSACPLLIGYEGSRPGIQVLEIHTTYAKKILMQGLCGGWLDAEEEEPKQQAAETLTEEQLTQPPKVTEMVIEKITAPREEFNIVVDNNVPPGMVVAKGANVVAAVAGGEATVIEPVSTGKLPAPVKQQKKAKAQPLTKDAEEVLKRADAAFDRHKGNVEQTSKVVAHLKSLVDIGAVPSSEAMLLAAKHLIDAEVVKTLKREVPVAE